jgi:hypothetical protein
MPFEWDERKRRTNLEKHGVDFAAATKVFEDPNLLERLDRQRDYGEPRFQAIGVAGDVVLFVAYTLRSGKIRIISARRATRNERKRYVQAQGR